MNTEPRAARTSRRKPPGGGLKGEGDEMTDKERYRIVAKENARLRELLKPLVLAAENGIHGGAPFAAAVKAAREALAEDSAFRKGPVFVEGESVADMISRRKARRATKRGVAA